MAKAKQSPQDVAIQTLSKALVDPRPLPLLGTNAKPGIFIGSSVAVKAAAKLSEESGWVEPTGELQGTGARAKNLFRITQVGINFTLQNSETLTLLRELLGVSDAQREVLRTMRGQLEDAGKSLIAQNDLVGRLLKRESPPATTVVPQTAAPPSATSDSGTPAGTQATQQPQPTTQARPQDLKWPTRAVEFVRDYRLRNPQQSCPLPELYRHIAQTHPISIGQFHDGLRQLVREQQLALQPYTGPMYQLKDEQYALLLGQEIKFYADLKQ